MNKGNAHEFIPLVHALSEGKIIQKRDKNGWIDLTIIVFYDGPEKYRVKPTKPRVGEYCFNGPVHQYVPVIELTNEVKDALEKAGIPYAD